MLKKLFAVCLLVDDFDKSLDFYTKVMGLKVKYQQDKFASFELPGTELSIFQKDAATAMFPKEHMKPSGGYLIGYQVDDLAKECDRLNSKDVDIFEGPKETDWGQKVAYFKDPNGNIWEVSEPFEE